MTTTTDRAIDLTPFTTTDLTPTASVRPRLIDLSGLERPSLEAAAARPSRHQARWPEAAGVTSLLTAVGLLASGWVDAALPWAH
jgi:hypothetical protein